MDWIAITSGGMFTTAAGATPAYRHALIVTRGLWALGISLSSGEDGWGAFLKWAKKAWGYLRWNQNAWG